MAAVGRLQQSVVDVEVGARRAMLHQILEHVEVAAQAGEAERREAEAVAHVHLAAGGQQVSHRLQAAAHRRHVQRRAPVVVDADGGAAPQQPRHRVGALRRRRVVQRRVAVRAERVDVGAMPQQQVRARCVAVRRRPLQRRLAPLRLPGACPARQHQLQHGAGTHARRRHRRRLVHAVRTAEARQVGVGAAVDQQASELRVARLGRHEQRRLVQAVGAVDVHTAGPQ